MEKKTHNLFGLIGKNIDYSFSRSYFNNKFLKEKINAQYINFNVENLTDFFEDLVQFPNLKGCNVTIPFKEQIIEFLDDLSPRAKEIGAVNCLVFQNSKIIGHNTDVDGVIKSFELLKIPNNIKCLILGTGGASKAIKYVLEHRNIDYIEVSRNPSDHQIGYQDVTKKLINNHQLIIHTTPVGTYPNVDSVIKFPFEHITKIHFAFDLIYNPEKTMFLKKMEQQGATYLNGLPMLIAQAEASWKLWNH